jgi:starch synthase
LPKGKVGGVGDVVRDLPLALHAEGWQSTILTPSYGMFHTLPGAVRLDSLSVHFAGEDESVSVYDVPGSADGVRNIVFEHATFSPHGAGQVYSEDGATRPFATDATKFALFGAAAAAYVERLEQRPDVVHLHDWHAAFYLLMREYAPHYDSLRSIRTVFTIHNLSYQGVRPLRGDESAQPEEVGDPADADCINSMAMAIRLADRISTVSPTYAGEICEPSDAEHGFIGGEGLEGLLGEARDDNRLVGILNGCYYNGPKGRRPGWQRILGLATDQLNDWPDNDFHDVARATLAALPKRRPQHVLTSVGRLVRQKASLFFEKLPDGRSALEAILDNLGSQGVLIILGSGEAEYEQQMLEAAKDNARLLFLRGYSETLAEPLYRAGDLFLMPSSFEPCGISQMLAMRATQPCIVHGVGGLKDTVADGRTGFIFEGDSTQEQAVAFVDTVQRALELKTSQDDAWQKICIRAASARFSWSKSARQTIEMMYEPH